MDDEQEARAVLVDGRARVYWGETPAQRAMIDRLERQGVDRREAAFRVCWLGEVVQ